MVEPGETVSKRNKPSEFLPNDLKIRLTFVCTHLGMSLRIGKFPSDYILGLKEISYGWLSEGLEYSMWTRNFNLDWGY